MKWGAVIIVLGTLVMLPLVARADGPTIEPLQGTTDPYQSALARLADILRTVFGPPAPRPLDAPITGTLWKWQTTIFSDDRRVETSTPERYTVQFGDNGRLTVRADCNTGFGSYRRDGERLSIGPVALTRALCPPDSLDQQFLAQLEAVRGVSRDGERLVLLLALDSGSMIFAP
jgi:heat shock protein HslJ